MPNPEFNGPIPEETLLTDFTPQPSHKDLYLLLGELSGQMKTVITMLNEKRVELSDIRVRVNELEKKGAVGLFLVIGLSLVIPTSVSYIMGRGNQSGFNPDTLSRSEVVEMREALNTLKEALPKTNQ